MNINQDICSRIGSTEYIILTFTDEDTGDPVDVSGYSFFFTLKTSNALTDDEATIKKEPTDFVISGDDDEIATVKISDTETVIAPGSYDYDIKAINGSGDVAYASDGKWTFTKNTTIRVS